MDGSVNLRISGEGPALVLLPPAPHNGSFFDSLIGELAGYTVIAADYPGYGGSAPIENPSIEAYAEAIALHLPKGAWLVGFHTGNLVAAELAKRHSVEGIVMIDVPYFDANTRASYAAKMDRSARNAAFHAAFAYDPQAGLRDLPYPVRFIATQSSLLDLTRQAAADMNAALTERMDIGAPVFEAHAKEMAAEIGRAVERPK